MEGWEKEVLYMREILIVMAWLLDKLNAPPKPAVEWRG